MNTDFWGIFSSFEIFFISFELSDHLSLSFQQAVSLSPQRKNQTDDLLGATVAAEQHDVISKLFKMAALYEPYISSDKICPNDKIPTQEVSCVGFDIPAIQFLREKRRKNFVMNSENSPSQSSYKKNHVVLANSIQSRHLYKRNFFLRDF